MKQMSVPVRVWVEIALVTASFAALSGCQSTGSTGEDYHVSSVNFDSPDNIGDGVIRVSIGHRMSAQVAYSIGFYEPPPTGVSFRWDDIMTKSDITDPEYALFGELPPWPRMEC